MEAIMTQPRLEQFGLWLFLVLLIAATLIYT